MPTRNAVYYAAHKAEQNAACKAYYEAHKKERQEQHRAWLKAHKEEQKRYAKSYRESHKNELKAKRDQYRADHPEYINEYRKTYYATHAANYEWRKEQNHRHKNYGKDIICIYCGKSAKAHRNNDGKFCSPECSRKYHVGERATNWQGGISFEPYCPKFNDDLRRRVRDYFNNQCVMCGKSKEAQGKNLHVHHVEYNKSACCDGMPVHFAALCHRCHSKTCNGKYKQRWENMLHVVIEQVYGGRSYFTKDEYEAGQYQAEPPGRQSGNQQNERGKKQMKLDLGDGAIRDHSKLDLVTRPGELEATITTESLQGTVVDSGCDMFHLEIHNPQCIDLNDVLRKFKGQHVFIIIGAANTK